MPTFDGPNLIITLDSGITEVDVKTDLYSEWKEWVKLSDNAKYPPAFASDGGNPLTPGIDQGAYFFIQNGSGWRIRPPEEDITIYFTGNLAPQEPSKAIAIPTLGMFTTFLVGLQPITQSVEQILSLQQDTAYNGVINIDLLTGIPGTTFPAGTDGSPVNNLDDAFTLAARLGIDEFHGRGLYIADRDFIDVTLRGAGQPAYISLEGFDFTDTIFEDMAVTGDGGGSTGCIFKRCNVSNVTNLSASFIDCVFSGDNAVIPASAGNQNFLGNCASFVPGSGRPSFSLSNSATNLQIRNWHGGLNIRDVNNPASAISIDISSGKVGLEASVTEGDIQIRGIGVLNDDDSGPNAIVDATGLVNVAVINASVVPDTAEAVHARDRYSKRDNMVYSTEGLLISGRERWFPSKAAADAATEGGTGEGETDTFTISASPDTTPTRPKTFDKVRDT